jgi:hypothetical protein
VEYWTLHHLTGGGLLFRIDQDGREADGRSVLAEALYDEHGKLVRFNVQSFVAQDPPAAAYKADYVFYSAYVQVGIQTAGERQYREFLLSDGTVPLIPFGALMGQAIAAMLAHGQQTDTFIPGLRADEPDRTEAVLVRQCGQETQSVGRRALLATCYQIGDTGSYWLDEHQILLRGTYLLREKTCLATLSNYAYAR